MTMRRRATEMTNEELRDAIEEAQKLAGLGPAGFARLGQYSAEAGRRLVERERTSYLARIAYAMGLSTRAFAVFWWVHAAFVAFLCAAALHDSSVGSGLTWEPLAIAAGVAGALIVVRWMLTGRWVFGLSW